MGLHTDRGKTRLHSLLDSLDCGGVEAMKYLTFALWVSAALSIAYYFWGAPILKATALSILIAGFIAVCIEICVGHRG